MFLTQSDFLMAWEHWPLLALFPTPRGLALLYRRREGRAGDSDQKRPEPRAAEQPHRGRADARREEHLALPRALRLWEPLSPQRAPSQGEWLKATCMC